MNDQRIGRPVTCSSGDAHEEYQSAIDLILGSETGAAGRLDRAPASSEAYIRTNPGDLLIISRLCGYLIFYGGPTKLTRVLDLLESVQEHLQDDWASETRRAPAT